MAPRGENRPPSMGMEGSGIRRIAAVTRVGHLIKLERAERSFGEGLLEATRQTLIKRDNDIPEIKEEG